MIGTPALCEVNEAKVRDNSALLWKIPGVEIGQISVQSKNVRWTLHTFMCYTQSIYILINMLKVNIRPKINMSKHVEILVWWPSVSNCAAQSSDSTKKRLTCLTSWLEQSSQPPWSQWTIAGQTMQLSCLTAKQLFTSRQSDVDLQVTMFSWKWQSQASREQQNQRLLQGKQLQDIRIYVEIYAKKLSDVHGKAERVVLFQLECVVWFYRTHSWHKNETWHIERKQLNNWCFYLLHMWMFSGLVFFMVSGLQPGYQLELEKSYIWNQKLELHLQVGSICVQAGQVTRME